MLADAVSNRHDGTERRAYETEPVPTAGAVAAGDRREGRCPILALRTERLERIAVRILSAASNAAAAGATNGR